MNLEDLDNAHYKILIKCVSQHKLTEMSLAEGSIRHLIIEKLDPSDVASVQDAVTKTKSAMTSLRSYADSLQLQNELKPMYEYIDALEDALDKTAKKLTNVSFESGKISKFFGKKLTLPALVAAAVKLNSKAVDFGKGFSSSMNKIKGQLVSQMKNVDKTLTLADAVGGDPDLDLEKIASGIKDELTKSLKGSFLQKVKGFFNKALLGPEADIMSAPELKVDMADLADKIADALINAKIENLLGQAPPKVSDESVTDLADEMQDVAEEQDVDAGDAQDDADLESEGTPEDAEAAIKDAVSDEAGENKSPLDAALDALDTWSASLSKSSQDTLKAAGRFDALKGGIKDRLENSADAIQSQVEQALNDWIAEHEETLVKSKKFSKKNFESLRSLIPRLAAEMTKKVSESPDNISKAAVHRFVNDYMTKKLLNSRLISENMQQLRWQKLAGIKNERN